MAGEPQDTMLELHQVGLQVGGRKLLQDICVQAAAGEMIALLGPNGAGKSSLLRVLAREYRHSHGEVHLAGRPMASWRGAELARRRAVMPQHTPVSFPFAADEVVALGLPGALSGRTDHPAVSNLMRALQVEHLARRFYADLSGGEQQRVQLARVLAQLWLTSGPKLLLLDECTSALDPAHQHRIMALLAGLARRGDFCVIAACHDLSLAATCASRIWLMEQGRLVADGTPAQVLQPERLEQVYGIRARVEPGHPPRVYVEGCNETAPALVWPEPSVADSSGQQAFQL